MAKRKTKWQKNWKPPLTYAEPEWDLNEKANEFLDVLLTGRFPLIELQDYLGVTPTKGEKKASGKYGYVRGILWLINNARLQGWPVQVSNIDGITWVWLPQHVMDEENDTNT